MPNTVWVCVHGCVGLHVCVSLCVFVSMWLLCLCVCMCICMHAGTCTCICVCVCVCVHVRVCVRVWACVRVFTHARARVGGEEFLSHEERGPWHFTGEMIGNNVCVLVPMSRYYQDDSVCVWGGLLPMLVPPSAVTRAALNYTQSHRDIIRPSAFTSCWKPFLSDKPVWTTPKIPQNLWSRILLYLCCSAFFGGVICKHLLALPSVLRLQCTT